MRLNKFEKSLLEKREGIKLILVECEMTGVLLLFLLRIYLIALFFFGVMIFLLLAFGRYVNYLHLKHLAYDHEELKRYVEYHKRKYQKQLYVKLKELNEREIIE